MWRGVPKKRNPIRFALSPRSCPGGRPLLPKRRTGLKVGEDQRIRLGKASEGADRGHRIGDPYFPDFRRRRLKPFNEAALGLSLAIVKDAVADSPKCQCSVDPAPQVEQVDGRARAGELLMRGRGHKESPLRGMQSALGDITDKFSIALKVQYALID